MGLRAFIWLIAAIVLVVIELMTMGLTSIWFAGGALLAMGLELAGVPFIWQLIGFAAASVLLFLLTRPLALKFINKDRERTNADRLIGEIGIVTEEISNISGTGRVKISGLEWTAKTEVDSVVIPAGQRVRVGEIAGVKLIVSELQEQG
ncbi:MAG: NfeD family protein [Lachnospiraceae bacterium]|nr:NfeD family protein [Lachnospiraceae bacterium]